MLLCSREYSRRLYSSKAGTWCCCQVCGTALTVCTMTDFIWRLSCPSVYVSTHWSVYCRWLLYTSCLGPSWVVCHGLPHSWQSLLMPACSYKLVSVHQCWRDTDCCYVVSLIHYFNMFSAYCKPFVLLLLHAKLHNFDIIDSILK